MKRFFKKVSNFIKRNAYALAVCACVVLALTLISVAAVSAVNSNTQVDSDIDVPVVPSGSDKVMSFTMPIEGGDVYKKYAEDFLLEDKTSGFWQTHQGIDFKASEGTKVLAVFDGEVTKVEHSMMDGLVVYIKHADDLVSVYKCLADDALVVENEKVTKGQQIGTVSSNLTEKADGAHLHFELYQKDKLIDPTPYFDKEGK